MCSGKEGRAVGLLPEKQRCLGWITPSLLAVLIAISPRKRVPTITNGDYAGDPLAHESNDGSVTSAHGPILARTRRPSHNSQKSLVKPHEIVAPISSILQALPKMHGRSCVISRLHAPAARTIADSVSTSPVTATQS